MIYSYVRISTGRQNLERQVRNIQKEYPTAKIIKEIYTGTKIDRKEWNKLFNRAKDGDTIVFDSVSRMSRNAEEGFTAYEELFKRGVELVFLKEPHINTSVFKNAIQNAVPLTGTNVDFILNGVNQYLLALAKEQIKLAFEQSEKEVLDLRQRTAEGVETARLSGKQIGIKKGQRLTTKKSQKAKEIILKHHTEFYGTLSDTEVMKLAEISHNTFYKYKKELKEGLEK